MEFKYNTSMVLHEKTRPRDATNAGNELTFEDKK